MPNGHADILTQTLRTCGALGLTDARARAFAALGLHTVGDLVHHFPFRVEQEAGEDSIAAHVAMLESKPAAERTAHIAVRGTLAAVRPSFGRKPRLEATLDDGTGTARLVFFNMPWLRGKLHPGRQGIVEGKAKLERSYLEFVNAKWTEVVEERVTAARSERMRAVYPSTEALPSRAIEDAVTKVLREASAAVPETLAPAYRAERGLLALADAYRGMHAPQDDAEFARARTRLAYDELLALQLAVALKRRMRTAQGAPELPMGAQLEREILARFPFAFTPDQLATFREIAADLAHLRRCSLPSPTVIRLHSWRQRNFWRSNISRRSPDSSKEQACAWRFSPEALRPASARAFAT
jgi:ATP-dependent DNA helicase RecG